MTAAERSGIPLATQSEEHRVAGRYRLDERIGCGRLGDVFSAVDEDYQAFGVAQHVAVQIVPDIVVRNNTLFNKLSAGYQSLRAAAHPTIVNYRHFGRDGKIAYLVMDLLEGASLRRLLDDVETLPLEEAFPVIRGAGEALKFLHAKSLSHGNLTADNVFITEALEVRLLDVVPLGAGESVFRGASASDASGRSAVDNDVFALACLAYEMLAGNHPFNHATAAEGKSAGFEPERIPSLSDAEWDTLSRALSLDQEHCISSVTEFMDGLGIKGTEHLRQTVEQPVAHTPVADSVPIDRPPDIPPSAVAPVPVSVVPSATDHPRPGRKRATKRGSPLRTVILGGLLAGLGAWSYFDEPDIFLADLVEYVDTRMNPESAERGAPVVTLAAQDSVPAVEPAVESESVVAAAEPELPVVDSDVEVSSPSREGESTASVSPEPAIEEAPSLIKETIVTVSERDGSARIAIQRVEGSSAQLVWWTSEHTARADADFIPVRRQIESGPADDDVLHIPLINDSLPEPRESFFVNLGREDTLSGQVERVATVRVDIVDDDQR